MAVGFTAFVMGALALPPAGANLSPKSLEAIDAWFKSEVAASGYPGGALAVAQGDKVVLVSTTGVADLSTGQPVTADTRFCIGSVTKSFTATAILQLRDEGKLNLDDPVTRYLPWFRVADGGAAPMITLRHLLTHTSGLPTNSHSVVWQDPDAIRNSIDRAVRELVLVPLHHPPGTTFEYANMNYVVLGRVIEAVSGESWADYIQHHVFAPLGMSRSTLRVPGDATSARPYWPEFGRLAEEQLQVGDFMAPASNILSTAPDLARYALAHLGTGTPIVSPRSLEEAHVGGAEKGPGERYAFGWINERFQGVTVVHHGGAAGHSTAVYLVPERQLAVVVLLGAYSHVQNELIARGVLSLALGNPPQDIDGPSELSKLTWVSRSCVGLTVLSPLTFLLLPLLRRRWRRRIWTRRYAGARAVLLTLCAATFWVLIFGVLPRNVPELPLPFGFYGWFQDLAVSAGSLLFTATVWALWSVAAFARHRPQPAP